LGKRLADMKDSLYLVANCSNFARTLSYLAPNVSFFVRLPIPKSNAIEMSSQRDSFPSASLKSPVASSASNNSPKFEETLGEIFLKKQELITLLLACPIMANRASRYNLLRGVRKGEFVTKIARNDVDLIEAENIVNTLLDYAGALEELITLVRRADSGTKALQALETFIRTLV